MMALFYGGFAVSLVLLIVQLRQVFRIYRSREERGGGEMPLSARCMIAVYSALVFIYLPAYLLSYEPTEGARTVFVVRPILLSLHNALRTFILDGEADGVIRTLYDTAGEGFGHEIFRVVCSAYTILLYIAAPLLTFGTVLSYFSDFIGTLRLFFTVRRPVYVMSELNERSATLADSIMKRYEDNKETELEGKPLIVYTNIRKRDDMDEELLLRARSQHAVMLRQDVESFSMRKWYRGREEIFLIGDESAESQNVSQAVRIVSALEEKAKEALAKMGAKRHADGAGTDASGGGAEKLKQFLKEYDEQVRKKLADACREGNREVLNRLDAYPKMDEAAEYGSFHSYIKKNIRYNVGVFVFATKKSSAAILDSVDYGTLLMVSAVIGLDSREAFRLRRVDDVRQLAWQTVSDPADGMWRYLFTEETQNEGISVLMVGLGRHGTEFLKFLLWYCQADGFSLRLNLIDKEGISDRLAAECPELMEMNRSGKAGDGVYDILCLDNTEIGSSQFYELFEYAGGDPKKREIRDRLVKTNVVLISLGDDDLNIQTSLDLRAVFDRMHRFKAKKSTLKSMEKPQIFTIVYDVDKTRILEQEGGLINYKEIPYNIHFAGSILKQYDYDSICDFQTERTALMEHIDWAGNNLAIWMDLDSGDPELFRMLGQSLGVKDLNAEAVKARYDLSIEYYDYTQERMKFERFEYYRLSSVARVLHARLRGSLTAMGLMPSFDDTPADNAKKHDPQKRLCRCSACQANRVSEHMRWNVYMRTGGYRLGERRDRALTHNNLIPFDRLDPVEQAKDCNCTVLSAENPPIGV